MYHIAKLRDRTTYARMDVVITTYRDRTKEVLVRSYSRTGIITRAKAAQYLKRLRLGEHKWIGTNDLLENCKLPNQHFTKGY